MIDHSRAGTLGAIARAFDADYVYLPQNTNDGAAHNFAIRCGLAQGCDYHMVLDPGIHFPHEVIPAMLAYMETHRKIGLLSPGIDDSNRHPQHPCKLRPTPLDLLMRFFGLARVRAAARPGPSASHGSGDGLIWEAPALPGCFMLIRGSVLHSIGGFDECMFPSFGNLDLARRIGSVARTRCFPGAAIGCDRGQGTGKSLRNLIGHTASAIRYFNKWGWFADAERNRISRNPIRRAPMDRF